MNRHVTVLAGLAVALTAYRAWVILHLGIDPYVDEAYYWGWSQALDWGYFSKPPLIALLIRASTAAFGDTLLALKLPSLLLYPATALVMQAVGSRMLDPRVGFWSGFAFLVLPLTAALGLFVSTDAPLLFCWALGLWLLWLAVERGGRWPWLALGLVVGAGLMSKYTMLAFAGSAFLALLADPRGRACLRTPAPWLAFAIAVAVVAPNLWWNWQHDFPTFRHTAAITRLDHRSWNPGEFFEFLGAQWASLGLLLGPILAWAVLASRRLWPQAAFRWLLLFCVPLLALVAAQALTGRANGNWAAPAYVAGTILAVAFLVRTDRRRLLRVALALNVVTMLAAYHWPDIAQTAGIPLTKHNDPYKRARGWDATAAAIRPYLAAHPDATVVAEDREILAELIYFLHPHRYARWNPHGEVSDHYELTASLRPDASGELLFVFDDGADPAVLARFAQQEQLGVVDIAVHRDFHRRFAVYLLRGFRGYAEAGKD